MKDLAIILTFWKYNLHFEMSYVVIKLSLGNLNKAKIWCLLSMVQKEGTVNNWGKEVIQWSLLLVPSS